jgi:Sigma 54 modulation protein / S30EA ribosomal protein
MQILVSSDDRICCDAELIQRIEGVVEGMLERFTGQVTRVEVRLSDLDSSQMGDRDKRCLMEARISGLQPVAATHEAATLTEAIHDAAEQLRRALGEHLRRAESESGPEMQALPILKTRAADQDA